MRMRSTRILAKVAGLLVIAFASFAHAGINSWTMTGPEGGPVYAVAYHPTQSGLALISTSRGLYRTTDDGGSWTLVHRLYPVAQQISFDPSNPSRVFVANGELLRSEDAGLTFTASPSAMPSNSLMIEISAAGTLYTGNNNGSVWRSTDHGSTWTACARPFPVQAGSTIFSVDPNAGGPDRLYLAIVRDSASAGAEGTWRSIDGCANWIAPAAGSPGLLLQERIQRYAVMLGDSNRVLAASNMGVYLSTDAGLTWARTYFLNSWHVEFDRTTPGRAYSMGEYGRFIVSNSGGSAWSWSGITNTAQQMTFALSPTVAGRLMAATVHGPMLSNDAAAQFTRRVSGIRAGHVGSFTTAHDGSIYTVLYSGAEGVFRRDPASGDWQPLNSAPFTPANLQLPAVFMNRAAVAPSDPSLIYAAVADFVLMRSTDGGSNWTGPNSTLRTAGASTGMITVDPDDAQIAYNPSYNLGFWKTVDRGVNWTRIGMTLPAYLTAFTIDPNNSAVLYVAGSPGPIGGTTHVFKSMDAGASWVALGATPPTPNTNEPVISITVDPHNTLVMYAGLYNQIYKTVDGGITWTQMTFDPVSGPQVLGRSIRVDPVHQGTITISAGSYAAQSLLRTVNGGTTWEAVPLVIHTGVPSLQDMVLDPARPGRVIASAWGASVGEYEFAPDLGVTMANMSSSLTVGVSTPVRFTVRNHGPHASSPADLRIDIPPNTGASWPAGCSLGMQVVYCEVPALQVNAEHEVNLYLHPLSATSGSIAARLTTHETDPAPANDTTSFAVTAGEVADIDLTLTATPATLDRGTTTELVAVLVNHGPSAATNVGLNLSGLSNFVVTSTQTDTGACSASANPTCTFGTMAANTTATVRLTLRADTAGLNAIIGAATSSAPDADGQQSTAYLPINVTRVADVSVAITESADPVIVDAVMQYTVAVQNVSGDPGPVQLVVDIGSGLIVGAAANTGTCTFTVNRATCDFVPTPSATLRLDVSTILPTIMTAAATATYAGTDSNPGNNTVTVGTTVRRDADFNVSVVPSVTASPLNTEFRFTAAVRNDGPNSASAAVSFTLLQAQIDFIDIAGASCSISVSTATCPLASVASGATANFVVRARGVAPGSAQAQISVTSTAFDTDSSDNNASSAIVVLTRQADVGVSITDSADPVMTGTPFFYTATVQNLGPNAGNVHVVIPVTGATVTSATSGVGTCTITASQAICDLVSLGSGASGTIRIDVNPASAGTAQAAPTVTFDGTDGVAANNSATESTLVNAPPSSSSSSGGAGGGNGGGGGGRFDWLALLLLGGIAWRRRSAATTR